MSPLLIPNIESLPTFPAQAVPDFTDWQVGNLGDQATGVISGCLVSPHTGSDMNVSVASGVIEVAALQYTVTAAASTAIAAASSSDRRDLVIFTPGIGVETSGSSTTNSSVITGTPCGTAGWSTASTGLPPVKPQIPAGSVLLAEVYVGHSTTAIATGNLVDKTALVYALVVNTPTVSGGAVVVSDAYQVSNVAVSATTAITMSTTAATDGQKILVRLSDAGAVEMLSWVNTENSTQSVPATSPGSSTLPLTVGFMFNGATGKWRCLGSA